MLKIVTQMLQRSYSVASQTVPIKSSFDTMLIPYPWVISDITTDMRDKGLEVIFLDFVTPSPICSIPCSATSFLGSHSQLCRIFFQVVNFYSSETKLDKVYAVDVIWGNDLRNDGCKKVQEIPCSTFPAKG